MTTVYIYNKKTDVVVPYGYEDTFRGKKFVTRDQFEKAVRCASEANKLFRNGIILNDNEMIEKAKSFDEEIDKIFADNEADLKNNYFYDLREDISDYEYAFA